jgi:hypothetical protein
MESIPEFNRFLAFAFFHRRLGIAIEAIRRNFHSEEKPNLCVRIGSMVWELSKKRGKSGMLYPIFSKINCLILVNIFFNLKVIITTHSGLC